MNKLFVVDDHQMMVDGIVSFFEKEKNIEIVGVANSFDEAKRKIINGNLTIDLLLTDLNLQGKNGLELITEIKKYKPSLKTIVFTMYFERALIKELMALKVNGFVEKNAPQDELKNAVFDVLAGKNHYPKNIVDKVNSYDVQYGDSTIKDTFASKFKLSKRELEIALLVIEGLNTEQIAMQLKLSPATVSTHRKNLNNKTNTYTPLDLYKLFNNKK